MKHTLEDWDRKFLRQKAMWNERGAALIFERPAWIFQLFPNVSRSASYHRGLPGAVSSPSGRSLRSDNSIIVEDSGVPFHLLIIELVRRVALVLVMDTVSNQKTSDAFWRSGSGPSGKRTSPCRRDRRTCNRTRASDKRRLSPS